MKKQLQQMLSQAERDGFVIERTRNQHFKIMLDGRCVAHCASMPRDPRGLLNFRAQLRRALRGRGDTLAA